MPWSLCWMISSVLLKISSCASVMYLPACHDHCTGWQALYCLPRLALWQICINMFQHVMIIVLDDELCTTDHFMLCACTVLISMAWSVCWPAEHVLMCVCTVLTCMSWSFCWMTSFVLLNKSCCVTVLTFTSMSWSLCRMTSSVLLITSCCVYVLYLQACHDHCAGWQALYC